MVGRHLKRFQKNQVWHQSVVMGTQRYPQVVEKIFYSFFLYIYIVLSLFYLGRMQFEEISIKVDYASLRDRRNPQVPQMIKKNFFNRFSSIFTLFWITFTLVERNLKMFQKSPFRHPCVVVGTPRYPQMVEKIFFIVFPAYLHHSESLLLWSNAIWWGFKKGHFGIPAWS